MEKAEEDFLKRLLREDPQHTVRRFLVQVNEAGELVSAEGILGESPGTDRAETNPKTGCDAGDTDAGSSTAGRTGDPCKRR